MIDVRSATLQELVIFHNRNNLENRVVSFPSIEVARVEVRRLIDRGLPAIHSAGFKPWKPRLKPGKVPQGTRSPEPSQDIDDEDITEEQALAEIRAARSGTKEARSSSSSSDKISESWSDPDIAKARVTRDRMIVQIGDQKSEFKSCREAFVALGLPLSKCTRFRMKVKAEGSKAIMWEGAVYLFSLTR